MFDCFGVISTLVLPPWFKRNFGLEKGKELEVYYCSRGDRGEMSLKDIAHDLKVKYQFDEDKIFNEWISTTKINEELISLIKELRKDNYVVLASNAAEGLVENVFNFHNIHDLFDKVFISYKMKKVKPNFDFYQEIVSSFDVTFEKVVMVDDRLINLEHLPEIGVHPIQYKDMDLFKEEFDKIL